MAISKVSFERGKTYNLIALATPINPSEEREIRQILLAGIPGNKNAYPIIDCGTHFEIFLMRLIISPNVDSADINIYSLDNYDIAIYIEYYLSLIFPKLFAWHFPKACLKGLELREIT